MSCPRGKIRRSGYTRSDGIYVRPTCVPDVGAPGKTPSSKRWSPPVKTGAMLGWSKDKSANTRHGIIEKVVDKSGYATTVRRLNWLKNISADKTTQQKAKADIAWLQRNKAELAYASDCQACTNANALVAVAGIAVIVAIAYFIIKKKKK